MAMIDYGCVVIKNGIVQNANEFFMDMHRTVGWDDNDYPAPTTKEVYQKISETKMAHNYMGYIGDFDLTICFYKCYERIHLTHTLVENVDIPKNKKVIYADEKYNDFSIRRRHEYDEEKNVFIEDNWISKSIDIEIPNYGFVTIHVKYISNSIKMLWMSYKGDFYRVIYGYGIDSNFEVWNKIKVKYLGKTLSKKIDKLYHQYIKFYGYKALVDTDLKYLIGFNDNNYEFNHLFDSIEFYYGIPKNEIGYFDPELELIHHPESIDALAEWLNNRYEEDNRFVTMYLPDFSKYVSIDNPIKCDFFGIDENNHGLGEVVCYIYCG